MRQTPCILGAHLPVPRFQESLKIAVLPSADGEEMLGQLETNLLWDAQVSVVHEGTRNALGWRI